MSYPLRVVHDLRPALPWTVFSLPFSNEPALIAAPYEQRFAIHWDEDNDERVLAAVLDVFFRRPAALANMYAVGEHKGSLSIWAASFPVADQAAWAAASKNPAIQDEWPVEPIRLLQETTVTGGRRPIMGEGESVRKFPPVHDELNWLIHLFGLGPTGPRCPW